MIPLRALVSPLFTAALVMALLPCAFAQQSANSSNIPTVAEQYLLSAANQERATRNLPPLHRDFNLAQAAAQHAQVMATHGSISHQFPGEPELSARVSAMGVAFSLVSENVAEAPSAVLIHTMWMDSPGHRANLLDPAIDAAGIGIIAVGGQLYAVEDFARTVPSLGLAQQESTIGALIAQPGRIALDITPTDISSARQTCAMSTGFSGTRKPSFVMRFTSSSLTQLPSELNTLLASGRYHHAVVGACASNSTSNFSSYNIAVLLYP